MNFKRSIMAVFMFMFLISSSVFASANFKAGKYVGAADGFGGEVKVEVTVSTDKIEKVEVTKHTESPGISDHAIKSIPEEIVEYQSVEVDVAAGATLTSTAIKNATKNALEHSGVDMKEITKKVEKKMDKDLTFDKEADVVIIGAGGAGLAAGVSAYENGAKSVIILEKMQVIGGNTIRSGGAMNAVNPPKQKAQGIEDSVELHFQQTYEGGDKKANPVLVQTLVENGTDAVYWLEKHGMVWREKMGSVIGSIWTRSNQATKALGTEYIDVLEKSFKEFGGKIYTEVKATELVKENDRVVAVVAEDKLNNKLEFKANRGVVIASGGYAASAEMVREYLDGGVYTKENFPTEIATTNHPGATGDGIIMAKEAGSAVIDMHHIQLLPLEAGKSGPTINVENSIFINKEGKRYVKEDGRRDEICIATFKQKDGQYYMINDYKIIGDNRKTLTGYDLDELIKRGLVVEAETLEELAKKINVEPKVLVETVTKFNEAVDKKSDEFGRKIWANKIDKGPFHATLRRPALHHTMGGIKIDKEARVLDANDKPIAGLYAAGEVTGGIHGANRLGGNALTDVIVFGKIAGKNIMK